MPIHLCSSVSLKYHPLQRAGSIKSFKLPSTQISGLLSSSQRKKYSSIKCSNRLFYLTNKIRNNDDINHKALNKSTVVSLALQDGYVSPSFVDVLKKKLYAFYRLSRPYVWISLIIGILSSSLLPVQSVTDLTPTFFIQVLKSTVPTLVMNIFVSAINQVSDVEIDKINKPDLPLASGDLSIGEGIAIAVITTLTSLTMGIMLRSPPLVLGLIARWIGGAAYSINHPFLRWKGNPLMAAVTIKTVNVLTQFFYFVHVQKYVLGRPLVFMKPLLFGVAFMGIFSVALSFLKDLPDVEGDKAFGVRTLPVILGKEKVFSISVNMMLMAYGAAVLAGASSPFVLCKLVTIVGHCTLGFILWRQTQTIDLSDTKSTSSFVMFMMKLYYVEFLLIPFVR